MSDDSSSTYDAQDQHQPPEGKTADASSAANASEQKEVASPIEAAIASIQEILTELAKHQKEADNADKHHDEVDAQQDEKINKLSKEFKASKKFNRRAVMAAIGLAILYKTGDALWENVVGSVYEGFVTFNAEGVVVLEDYKTGRCSFAGKGTKTPYDLTITNSLAQAQHAMDGQKHGHCFDAGGSIGNLIAATADGFEFATAAAQPDVHAYLQKQGKIDSLEVIIGPDEDRFESALLATADNTVKSLSDIRARIKNATPENPFIIAYETSGSLFTGHIIIENAVVRGDPSLKGKYKFVQHKSGDDVSDNFMKALHTPGKGHADLAIAVQYPGLVDGKYRGSRAYIAENLNTHMVSVTPEEFESSLAESVYDLRRTYTINGKNLHLISMNTLIAARKPESIQNAALRLGVTTRNKFFREFAEENAGLFKFNPSSNSSFPFVIKTDNTATHVSRRRLLFNGRIPGLE